MSGKKLDDGKVRYELVPPEFVHGTAVILTFGGLKYAPRNWEQGISWGRCFGALMGHLWKWWWGQDKDAETGCSHLWHAACELAFLISFEARGMREFDDRFTNTFTKHSLEALSPLGREMPAIQSDVRLAHGCSTRDDVSQGSGEPPAQAAASGKDVQPVPRRDSGQLVLGFENGPMGRVQVDGCAADFCAGCAVCEASAVVEQTFRRGP